MTRNQIDYLRLQEDKRKNVRSEELQTYSLNETVRHNKETERQSLQNLGILDRNAAANEANARSNAKNADTNWYNARINEFNAESNRMNAQSNARNAATNERNASTNWYNAETNRSAVGAQYMMANAALKQADVAEYRAQTDREVGNSTIKLNEERAYSEKVDRAHTRAQTDLVYQQSATERSRRSLLASEEALNKSNYDWNQYYRPRLTNEQIALTRNQAVYYAGKPVIDGIRVGTDLVGDVFKIGLGSTNAKKGG